MKKTFAAAVLAALTAAAAVVPGFARGRYEEPAAPAVLRVAALKGPTGLGMIKLFRDPPELGAGVSADFAAYGSPDVLLPRLLTGEVDIAALPTNLAANLYNRGAPYRLVAVIGNGVLYLVTTDPAAVSLESYRGRVLQNVAKGSTTEFIVRHLLERKGLAGDVNVQFKYGTVELAGTIVAGRETSGILPEPFATKALLAAPGARIAVDIQKEWAAMHPGLPAYPMTALVAKKSLIESRPGAVRSFLEEYRKSQEWVLRDPASAGELAEKLAFGITKAEAADAVPRCGLAFVPAREARPSVEGFLSVFLKFAPEAVGGKLPDEGFYAAP
jgi:NitT/TauT family transport system substrate-binding protein